MFLGRCQDCGQYVPLENAIWGQEYPDLSGSDSVPFCNDHCLTRYKKEFLAEKEKFLREVICQHGE